MRLHDRDRYLTAAFAAPAARDDLFALYAFNIEIAMIREAVSEPILGEIRLQWWRDTIDGVLRGEAPEHPVAAALARAMARNPLPRGPFEAMIGARSLDLTDGPPETLDDLVDYARGVSSSLVGLAIAALGGASAEVEEAGRHAGIAWALTGLIRAHPFHAGQGRLYLPRSLLDDAGVAPGDALRGDCPPGLADVVRGLADEARARLGKARRAGRGLGRDVLPAFLPMRLASLYLGAIERAGYNPYALKAGPTPLRKLLSVLGASLTRRF